MHQLGHLANKIVAVVTRSQEHGRPTAVTRQMRVGCGDVVGVRGRERQDANAPLP
jgi:hypothetical protein